ncbi:Protein of unknown function [Flavobacterium indicum GPTSA100-9 = DSM 17447]|jgi:Mlc titration factor MtfA (ptsG expression regulator)|uniref:Zinc-dependent peptidase n=1 Tax=Flavobacterium indicum (strain DSM 17447 / CIP 109464 / GPTSA100-9) TaxID=1094466 RepID=H8XQ03_FLAIG|nr:zinc-dependent peptidase [Flavobacterium indicum]CCG54219.1 Protein of unknown function [Flavobacterium indicum GPTSA100-9 = DSM 17447]
MKEQTIAEKYELVFADYIGMVLCSLPLFLMVGYFGFYVFEIIYLRKYKKPLFVFAHTSTRKMSPIHQKILYDHFSYYRKLKPKYKSYFNHRVYTFIDKIKFESLSLVITDEMKLLIAGTHVMLTFGLRDYLNPLFKTIYIHPDIYFSEDTQEYHKGEFNPKLNAIIFSWKHFYEGIHIKNDNLNLGLHEFTHALHIKALKSDKTNNVLFRESLENIFRALANTKLKDKLIDSGIIRDYAFENQFEFVAVLLEHFFESPEDLKTNFPYIYTKISHMINYNEKYFA